jgi:protein-tyrosine phosphatase
MVLEAEKLGIKAIIATPHFHQNIFNAGRAAERCTELASRISDCGILLYIGYEVFISPNLPDLVRSGRKLTLGDSRYLLLELPFDSIPAYSSEVIYELHLENIIPVIAHPERNRSFLRNIDSFIGFVENGCLVQVDAASIVGVYGSEVRKFARRLLKLKVVNYIASDAHCAGDYSGWYLQAYRQVCRWEGKEYADALFLYNPQNILDDFSK